LSEPGFSGFVDFQDKRVKARITWKGTVRITEAAEDTEDTEGRGK